VLPRSFQPRQGADEPKRGKQPRRQRDPEGVRYEVEKAELHRLGHLERLTANSTTSITGTPSRCAPIDTMPVAITSAK
jgi:hypothetical protein